MHNKIKTLLVSVLCLLVLGGARSASAEAQYILKFAALAPEGSTWMNIINAMNQEIQQKTGGQVALKIYPGGVSGDERDVLRKIRVGQLQAGGFTGIGLGELVPAVRIFELPMLFRSYDEVDAVTEALRPEMAKAFAEKGFELLGWAEAGFAHLMTNKPVRSRADLSGMKMWGWEGDPLVETVYKTLSISPVYMGLPDVLVSLQTGIIDGVYNSYLGTVALQWFAKLKYVTEDPALAYVSGALLVSKSAFSAIPAAHQATIRSIIASHTRELILKTRKENEEAKLALKQNGMEFVSLTPEAKTELEGVSKEVHKALVGKLYPQAMLDRVYQILASKRQ